MFFLYILKEQIEMKRSYATFFRKAKVNRKKYNTKFLRTADKAEIEWTDVGYKVFCNVRGTAPYFQQVKLKVMGMIRQLGAPQLFLTMSAAEAHWTELIKMLLQKERKTTVSDDDVNSMSRPDINKLISRNVVDVTSHFNNRMKILYKAFTKPGVFGQYKTVDHFYRIEFQQRGAPQVHSLLWLVDNNGDPPPKYDKTEESKKVCCDFIDSVICGRLPGKASKLHDKVHLFQSHAHTFTCRKMSKKIKIPENEGFGRLDGHVIGPELLMDSCRFKFPKFPMKKTTMIDAPDSNTTVENIKQWKADYFKVRKFILRQTYSDQHTEMNDEFMKLKYDEFLHAVGLTHDQYLNALRICVASNRSGSEVFLQRDCCDLFTNNYNLNLLYVHHANMDLSFIIDEYACVAYILGYLTKNESGLSRLLHQIDMESAKYGRTPTEKIQQFSHALDNSREVSRPEVVYRMLSLHFFESTRTHDFIQASHPRNRDGILKGNIDELPDDANPFQNNIIDYYVKRPNNLEDLSLAEFVRNHNIVYLSKDEKKAREHLNPHLDDDEVIDDTAPGATKWLKNHIGRFKHVNKNKIVRYHLPKYNETEMKRSLLLLFHPFRNEMNEIHEVPGHSVDDVYKCHRNAIEAIRKNFEPNKELLINMEQAMDNFNIDNEDTIDDMLADPDHHDDQHQNDTDSDKDLQHFLHLASIGKPVDTDTIIAKRESVCAMVRQLNPDQRSIFDDVIERFYSIQDEDLNDDSPVPFHLYIFGRAGTGKTFLMKTLIEATKLILMKSGDDLSKPSVLVLSPTASAARLINGQTIESALGIYITDDREAYQKCSKKSTLAHEYEQLQAIFIDEISMVGANKLLTIHNKLQM
jgi:hypothetical protein